MKTLIKLLNELHEENQSKQKLLYLSENKIENLLEENEQLKKSIKRQQSSNEECSKYIEEVNKKNEKLKAQLKDCENSLKCIENSYSCLLRLVNGVNGDLEWLRDNTVWEQMPSNKKTFTTTSVKEEYK